MAYSAPRTWTAGEVPTAAQFNQDIRDNVAFLANPPACRVYNSSNQSVPHDVDTAVTFDSERYDTASLHSTSAATSRVTVPAAGLYLLAFSGQLVSATDYVVLYAFLRLNGSSIIGIGPGDTVGNGVAVPLACSTVYKLAASDYVEAVVRHANGAAAARNLLAAGNYSPELSATWLGLG